MFQNYTICTKIKDASRFYLNEVTPKQQLQHRSRNFKTEEFFSYAHWYNEMQKNAVMCKSDIYFLPTTFLTCTRFTYVGGKPCQKILSERLHTIKIYEKKSQIDRSFSHWKQDIIIQTANLCTHKVNLYCKKIKIVVYFHSFIEDGICLLST